MDRRRFLGVGAGVTAGLAGFGSEPGRADAPAIRRYVTLGNTGLRVSDISFGSSRSADPDLVRHAAGRGITYFDTAESYRGGRAEEAIGEALRGERDRYVIASKHKAWGGESRRQMQTALEGSLRRLRTDYVDIYFNHAVNDVRRLQNPEWAEFTDRAVRDGKIRYRGVSGHGGSLVECLDYALDHDLTDVILVSWNFAQDASFYEKLRARLHYVALQPGLARTVERAGSKGVGVIAMKTLMGARINDMRPWESNGATFSQAAFRWVLAEPARRRPDRLDDEHRRHRRVRRRVGLRPDRRGGHAAARPLRGHAGTAVLPPRLQRLRGPLSGRRRDLRGAAHPDVRCRLSRPGARACRLCRARRRRPRLPRLRRCTVPRRLSQRHSDRRVRARRGGEGWVEGSEA